MGEPVHEAQGQPLPGRFSRQFTELRPQLRRLGLLLSHPSRAAAVAILLIGLMGIVGSAAGVDAWTRLGSGWALMDASTALALLLIGPSLWLYSVERLPAWTRTVAQGLAVGAGAIGGLKLLTYAYQLPRMAIYLDPGFLGPEQRTEVSTGLCLLFASLALVLADTETREGRRRPAEFLAGAIAAISVPVVMAYAFGLTRLPWRHTEMALHVGLAFLVFVIGILWLRPHRGWMALVTSRTVGGVTARRLLAAAIIVPFVLSAAVMAVARARLLDPVFAPSLLNSLILFTLVGLVLKTSALLHRSDIKRRKTEQRLWAQDAAGRALSEMHTLEAATPRVLSAIAEHLGWDVGLYWRVDRAANVLRCGNMWHSGQVDISAFASQARNITFRQGVGMPGRVWLTGRPAWNPDLQQFPSFRAWGAMESGLHAGFGFPVRIGADVVGVLEFFSKDIKPPDHDLMATLPLLGNQLGESMQRKAAEEELRASEERLRLLIEGVKDYAIFMLDTQGRVVSWNEAAERITGYAKDEALGQQLAFLYAPEDVAQEHPKNELQAAAEGRVEREGFRVRRDGSRFWANVVIAGVRDPSGALLGYTCVTRDMTERKKAEDELRRAKDVAETTNQELESFSYSVSHDLRAPLRTIDGFAQVLRQEHTDELNEVGRDYLRRIQEATQRMTQLINDLLKLAHTARGVLRVEETDLGLVSSEIGAALAAETPDRKVELVVQPDLKAQGDPRLLRVLLENLLNNAWKFTSARSHARIEIGKLEREGEPVFYVRDNGVGFDMGHADRLFRPFERLHPESEFTGMGIGLATVRRIVRRHSGRIWAEAKVGEGATFFFTVGEATSE